MEHHTQSTSNEASLSFEQFSNENIGHKKKRYSLDDMQHIAELYGDYYLKINTRSNVLPPHRIQINKKNWAEITEEYNKRQESLPVDQRFLRTEKAISDKWAAMRAQYQAKKDCISNTGSRGGPISGYLKTMHAYLHDDPQFHPKVTYSSLKRVYEVREVQEKENSSFVVEASPPPTAQKKQKMKQSEKVDEGEVSRLKSRDEALQQMKQITEDMTSKIGEIMSKPLVIQLVESEEKKEFYKKFLELMEKGLQ